MSETEQEVSALTRRYPAGTVLFEENDPGSRMYVIRKGRVRIYRQAGDNEVVLAVLGPGDFFGEMALLEGLPRSANAQTVEPVELIEVDGATFEKMLRGNTEIAVRMLRQLASRVRELDRRLQNLVVDNGVGRSLETLRWLLTKGKPEGDYVRLDASVVHIGIAAQAGIPPDEVQQIYNRLREAGCVKEDGTSVLVANSQTLDAFGAYLDLKRRYDPTQMISQVAAASDRAKKVAVQRLLKALRINEKDLETHEAMVSGQYKRYQELHQRFGSGGGTDR